MAGRVRKRNRGRLEAEVHNVGTLSIVNSSQIFKLDTFAYSLPKGKLMSRTVQHRRVSRGIVSLPLPLVD